VGGAYEYLVREGLLGSLLASGIVREHDLHLDTQHTFTNKAMIDSRGCMMAHTFIP
jgi:hypothetical protein